MNKEIYKAAVRGDVEFLTEAHASDVEAAAAVYSDEDLLGLTSHGNNIIHVAAKHGHIDFIKEALESFQASAADQIKLISATNFDGDTPLHLAAKQHTAKLAEFLVTSYQQLMVMCLDDDDDDDDDDERTAMAATISPWRVKNNKDNTPLHVALMNGGESIEVAAYLVGVGPEVASYCNRRNETPLHLAVKYNNEGAKLSMTKLINTLNGLGASLDYTKGFFEEDAHAVIKLLLETCTTVCCLRDADGMTPLLGAAINSYLPVVEAIINYCPESVEICDLRGKSILHHIKLPTILESRKFLSTPEISALIDQQDNDGNTPLHIAIMNCDYGMVKTMMECNANFVIKNYQGASPASLIQSESSSFLDQTKENMKSSSNHEELMTKELYEAAGNGEWRSLREGLEDPDREKYFLSRLPDGSNIIHVALEDLPKDYYADFSNCSNECVSLQELFIEDALRKFPILSCQTNLKGQTPLHLAMSRRVLKPGGIPFVFLQDHLRQIKGQRSYFPLPPWEAKDVDGETLLHVALKYRRYKFAEYLIELDAKLVREVNNAKESPLHKLCRHGGRREWAEQEENDMVDLLIEKDMTTVYSYDIDGLTPLLRAVQLHRLKIAARIIHHCPQSIKQFDPKFGRGIFHLILFHRNDKMVQEFCKVPQLKHLLTFQDDKENTPLHVAVEQRRFGTVKFLMEHLDYNIMHYDRINRDNNTVIDLIATVQNSPRWFQDFLSSKWMKLPQVVRSGKSLYGIHHSDMKEFMGTLAVVAALLATITFTAAFTVPGGYNNEKGTPILAKTVAFQVFMISDAVGMCSSMMVLFCLLWFLNSGRFEREGSDLVDLSIGLLQLSFYATLLAFTTGVYVTTSPDVQWLAIFICAICSFVLVLMRKRFILDFVVHVFYVLFSFSQMCAYCLSNLMACLRWIVHNIVSRR